MYVSKLLITLLLVNILLAVTAAESSSAAFVVTSPTAAARPLCYYHRIRCNINIDVQKSALSLSKSEDEAEENEREEESFRITNEKRRMSDVRAVQNIFYSSSSTDDDGDSSSMATAANNSPYLDYETGVFCNLPLWREKLGFTELPGRSLIGFVKDPSYTHMFEELLRRDNSMYSSSGLYFGQLRLDNDDVGINVNAASPTSTAATGSTKPLPRPRETDMNAPLYSWKDRITNDEAVVVGTLMQIRDHVRLDDGRLMLLIHAVERFVVLEPKRTLPYPVANVLILPDEEEEELVATSEDNSIGCAVAESLLRWNGYEFDASVKFPIEGRRDDENADGNRIMSLNEVLSGDADVLGTLLPYAPYRFSYEHKVEEDTTEGRHSRQNEVADSSLLPNFSQLIESDIMREVESFSLHRARNPTNMQNSNDIEKELWILIDEYVQLRGVANVFPKHLLSLLPRDNDWPETFTLHKLATAHSGIDETFSRVADQADYPSQRRQKRLSYACTALLGGPVDDHPLLNRTMRRRLLEVPSTRGRLWAARELFHAYNSQFR